MPHRSFLLRVAGALLAVFLLAACGGDEEAADEAEPTDSAEQDEAEDAEGAEEDEPDEAGDDDAAGADSESAHDEGSEGEASEDEASGEQDVDVSFDSELSVRVTYEVQSEAGPDSTMTMAIDGDRYATRFSSEGTEALTVQTPEVTASCFQQQGQWMCGESAPAGGAETAAGADIDSDAYTMDESDIEAGLSGTRSAEIAGREAICGETESPIGDGVSGEVCVDVETGMLLSGRYDGPEGSGMYTEAIEFGAPSDEDFELPADAVDLSEMGDM